VGQLRANFHVVGDVPRIWLYKWMPYNVVADSFHTNKLCSRLSCRSEVQFCMENCPFAFLRRCMECRRCLAMTILSVCLSVHLSHVWIVTKRWKDLSRFLYHTKD